MQTLTLPLQSPGASLEAAGGKGTNLARLARAGFRVPAGFIVTTAAYGVFAAHKSLAGYSAQRAQAAAPGEPAALEAASADIRARFAAAPIPPAVTEAVEAAYAALGQPAVAVRSSATAEDLPDLSFAGQQETYLNVVGAPALLEAVRACWSSLWTARAIGYRARNGIDPAGVSLAVVVQAMVPADSAGVLFTANPLTGRRAESVIDAARGLGEVVVAGRVEPDQYIVETSTGRVLGKRLGRQALAIVGQAGGGVVEVPLAAGEQQALPDEAIALLVDIGRHIQAEFGGVPQDIEWAWAGGVLSILQSRPITSLFPLPDVPVEPLRVWFSFGAAQGMLDPITPLGRDAILLAITGGARLFGARSGSRLEAFQEAGERLWPDLSGLLRNPVGRRAALGAAAVIEPGAQAALRQLAAEPAFAPGHRPLSLRRAWQLLPRVAWLLGHVIATLARPEAARQRALDTIEARLEELRALDRAAAATPGGRHAQLAARVGLLHELERLLPAAMPNIVLCLIGGMATWNLLRLFLRRHLGGSSPVDEIEAQVLEVTRGLPHNETTTMDLHLWATAQALTQAGAASPIMEAPAAEVARAFRAGALPAPAQAALRAFLDRYGMRGLAEIDVGRPRWREDPTPVVQALQSYLRITDLTLAPDVVFDRGRQKAKKTLAGLLARLRAQPGGWWKVRVAGFLAGRARALMGMRESPKFFIVRVMGVLREAMLSSGQSLAEAGELAASDDVFFLTGDELSALARGEGGDWQARVDARRAAYAREKRRRQVPRLLVSDGRAFYEGVAKPAGDTSNTIVGSPVSPGVIEGRVRVVLDPHGASLGPGEILVCPGTDPSWTPLFLAAGGLVTEVGGLMTHGSVVAREYGIPAVVGVDRATERLHTGQRVRLDGTRGTVDVLPD